MNDKIIESLSKGIKINNVVFFKNSLPPEIKKLHPYYRNELSIGVFYEKNVIEPYVINTIHDLIPKNQPTESQVKNALIWQYGIKGEKPDYIIKSGGGSRSDHEFQSQIFNEIADPKTGLDKRVCLAWISSPKFKDILISDSLIRELANQFINGSKKTIFDKEKIEGTISFLLGGYIGKKINVSGRKVYLNTEIEDLIINSLKKWNITTIEQIVEKKKMRLFSEINQIKKIANMNKGTHLSIEFNKSKSLDELILITQKRINELELLLKGLDKIKTKVSEVECCQLSMF